MTVSELIKKIDPEEYRFTNLEKFLASANENTPSEPDLSSVKEDTIVVIDGRLSSKCSMEGLSVSEENGVVLIHLSKNILLEHALRLKSFTRENIGESKVKVIAESNSKLCLIEETSGQGITEISFELAAGARVEHIQLGSEAQFIHSASIAHLSKDSNYRNFIFNLEGSFARRNTEIRLLESGSHAESFCLYLVNGSEHSDIFTKIEHLAADTTSEQLAKGILDDHSKGIFTGKIHIHPDAQRVYSSQLNKNLLLSKKAQAHSQPQLEIFADDVKCSHGSTTGQLSDEEIFYFESRGIPHEKARTLLSWAFAMEVVKKVKNRDACELISSRVETVLSEKFKLKGIQ